MLRFVIPVQALRPDRCQSTARQRTSLIEVLFAHVQRPILRQLKIREQKYAELVEKVDESLTADNHENVWFQHPL